MPKCKFKVQYKKTIRWQWKSQRWKLKDQRYWNFYFTGKYFGHNYRNLQQTIKPLGSHHFDSSSSSSAFFCNFKDPSTALGSTVQWQFFHNSNSYCHPLWQIHVNLVWHENHETKNENYFRMRQTTENKRKCFAGRKVSLLCNKDSKSNDQNNKECTL